MSDALISDGILMVSWLFFVTQKNRIKGFFVHDRIVSELEQSMLVVSR